MSSEGILREVFSSWLARSLPNLIEREYPIDLQENVIAIIGPRRAGKTYFMFQIAKKLLEKGFSKYNIVYVDFEDVRLKILRPENYGVFVKVLHEMFKERDGKIVLLLDEIQNLEDWESWVRSLHATQNYYIFLSGSSSKLSSKEISTKLRGRYISRLVMPFSFREFLNLKGFNLDYIDAPEVKGKLLQNLNEYLNFGGFPDVVKRETEEEKLELLRTYKETIFYRDVVERFKVRDVASLDTFLNIVMENFGKYLSISKVERYFRGIGLNKSKKTLSNYLKYFETAFFLFLIEKFGYKSRERVLQPRKVYPIDLGFYKLIPRFSKDYGVLMESIVAIELFKQTFQRGIEVFYWKDYSGREVDFVIKKGLEIKELIQVTYASSISDVKEREVSNIVRAGTQLNCKELLVITWDYEGILDVDGSRIKFIPLWKWLLSEKYHDK